MYKFITLRCRNCGSVIYNLPAKGIRKLKHVKLTCEDCAEHSNLRNSKQIV